jgi:Skp family chaperone for outer membrane proteins
LTNWKDHNMTLISTCLAAVVLAAGQQGGSANVAVVNVSTVSARYARTADLEAQFEQRRLSFNEQRSAMQQRIQRLGQSLQEELRPGTPEFEARRKELAMQEAELQWFTEAEGQRMERGLAESLRSIYADIVAAVREVADEQGVDIVLSADQLPEEPAQTTTQVRQQIVLQKVLYWKPRVDLTEPVTARVNARYRAQKAGSSSGAAPPAAEPRP